MNTFLPKAVNISMQPSFALFTVIIIAIILIVLTMPVKDDINSVNDSKRVKIISLKVLPAILICIISVAICIISRNKMASLFYKSETPINKTNLIAKPNNKDYKPNWSNLFMGRTDKYRLTNYRVYTKSNIKLGHVQNGKFYPVKDKAKIMSLHNSWVIQPHSNGYQFAKLNKAVTDHHLEQSFAKNAYFSATNNGKLSAVVNSNKIITFIITDKNKVKVSEKILHNKN